MSRVYEALRRAEDCKSARDEKFVRDQKFTDDSGKATNGTASALVKPRRFDDPLSSSEPPLPVLQSSTPASAERVRGPALVVGRTEAQYRKVIEQFNLFAAGMQNWATEHDKRIFMLTSALSGEGKSFMALNLAASLARLGNRVVLVDADLRAPTLHRAFNLAPLRGLISYLAEGADLQSCLQATQVPKLLLVAAGGSSYTPTEALAGPRMRDFIHDLRSLAPPPLVIIDAPAAAAVPESQILNHLIDALVVVVAANRTPRAMVKQTIDQAVGTTIYGIALNRFVLPRSAARIYYPEKYSYALAKSDG